jgi:hypothetical protein
MRLSWVSSYTDGVKQWIRQVRKKGYTLSPRSELKDAQAEQERERKRANKRKKKMESDAMWRIRAED